MQVRRRFAGAAGFHALPRTSQKLQAKLQTLRKPLQMHGPQLLGKPRVKLPPMLLPPRSADAGAPRRAAPKKRVRMQQTLQQISRKAMQLQVQL